MVFCGLLSPLMNCIKPNNSPVLAHMGSKYSSELKYYTSACQQDSDLKTFDSSLHQRTTSVLKSLAEQGAKSGQSISQGSLMKVYEFLLDLNGDVVKEIIDSKEDIKKNKDLSCLVGVYFKSTSKTLEFCKTVDNCVKRAEISQLIIRYAVKQFEAESGDVGENTKKKYAKTLEELNKFKAMGDPFDGEFLTQYESSFYEEQDLLLEELSKLRAKLDKKQRNLKTWKRLSYVVYITALVSVLLLSMVKAPLVVPLLLVTFADNFTPVIELVGKWLSKMWKKHEKAVQRQRELVSTAETGAGVNLIATENIRNEIATVNIRSDVDSLRIKLKFCRRGDELATRLALQEIAKKVEGLTDKIKEVGQHAERFSGFIGLGRSLVLRQILSLPASSIS
ncbi:unnamed protein product [Eruca vesicaria subsp. sativa]|uniref:Uncharacterized protein n=1 Tax=Eruca vesicaria subsp. sativa TaxID=29727 RepID=A0ABC8JSP4_ERUVS|nr:unnamed protein product [Eruca vesicaria subsp. sativa]